MLFKFFITVVSTTIFAQVNFAHPTPDEASPNDGGFSTPIQSVDAANQATPSDFGVLGQNLESFDYAENIEDLKIVFEAFNGLPEKAYDDLEESVKRIVSKIPEDNIIKSHLRNGLFLMSLYERVSDGELDLNNPQEVMEAFEENPEAMEDFREEVRGTGNMVTSTLEQAPHVDTTKKSIAAVSEKLNTPPDTLIEEYKRQPSMQPLRQVEANYNGFPGGSTNGEEAMESSPDNSERAGNMGEPVGENLSW